MTLKPITREDMYYSYLINGTGSIPKPITRKEQYLYYLCANGFGNGGGTVTPEAIDDAVERYLTENPIDSVNLGNLPEATEITETDKLLLGQDAQNKSIEMSGFMDFMRENGLFDLDGQGRPLLPGYGIVSKAVTVNVVKGNVAITLCTVNELLGEIPIEDVVLCSATTISDKFDNSMGCYIDIDQNAIRGIWDYGPTITVSDIKVAVTAIYKKPVAFEPGLKTISIRKNVTVSTHTGIACQLSETGITDPSIIVSMSAISYSFEGITNVYAFLNNQDVMIYYPGNANTYVDQDIQIDILVKDYSSIGSSIVTEGIRMITKEIAVRGQGRPNILVANVSDFGVDIDSVVNISYVCNSYNLQTGYPYVNGQNGDIYLLYGTTIASSTSGEGKLSLFVKVPVVEQKLKPFTKDVEVTLIGEACVATGIFLDGSDDVGGYTLDNLHFYYASPLTENQVIHPLLIRNNEIFVVGVNQNQTGPCKIRIRIE